MTNEPVWTEWLENLGNGECPVPDWSESHQVNNRISGPTPKGVYDPKFWDWQSSDITHYRYAVPADLEWLAENVSEWLASDRDSIRIDWVNEGGLKKAWSYTSSEFCPCQHWYYDQWLRARRDLGYESQGNYVPGKMSMPRWGREMSEKQARYIDGNGDDWIDEFARTSTPEEFRGAMRFTIGKYNRRAGKKDELISEIRKMRDYCDRWLEYEGDNQ